jgi:hypothetical protein
MKRHPIEVDYDYATENVLCKFQCVIPEIIASKTQETRCSGNTAFNHNFTFDDNLK